MPLPVPDVLTRLKQAAHRLRRSRLAAATIAVALLAGLFVWTAETERWIVSVPLILLIIHAGFVVRKVSQLLRQMRLEQRFVAHAPTADPLRRTLRHPNHLWQRSLLLQALRSLLARPLPPLTSRKEKEAYLRERFSRAFAPLRPTRMHVGGLLLVAAGVLAVVLLPLAVPPPYLTAAAVLIALGLANEVIYLMEQARLQTDLKDLDAALSAWTIDHQLDVTLRHDAAKPYVHTIDYYAPPWFA